MELITSDEVRNAELHTSKRFRSELYWPEDVDELLDRVVFTLEAFESGVVQEAARRYLELHKEGKE
ncbi:hypothetical protein [Bifidobacterium sp. ESL0745]|uniref:hypothetical protein n=1 Tax=Bifidobacterium sp. ESL0745 TaxID=2983226 RepID=UPI0023FA453D|nr:hypothetical protein [Bifidobacterium sp. ESL0745]MDF7665700.1 hypothetical protein [Bifidobacterium sp. ESL0745]